MTRSEHRFRNRLFEVERLCKTKDPEHEASREGCVVCHSPHGSVNQKMLKARNANLCLQCHFQEQTAPGVILIGGRDHASVLTRGTCWSGGCHEAVHGSHVSSSLRF